MIDRQTLLKDLQELLPLLEIDLRERVAEVPALDASLRAEYAAACEAARTAQAYEEWREEPITQAAVAWILACVFVRFMEDNGLVETPRLAGPADRLKLARDHHTVFFQQHPTETDREYLLDVFREVAKLPAARELFDERHNPLWTLALSGDGARRLLDFWQEVVPSTGDLLRNFTDPDWNTRFLGDLYQDLSKSARKKYALLQTPEFVEEFILDRTLTPAINTFGLREVRLIDPTCGSGHFLLGTFHRLFTLHQHQDPATNPVALAQRALDGVYGVDLNPFATAIARFRLLVAALRASGVRRLADAPGFRIHVATGDSLLHGRRFSAIAGVQAALDPSDDPLRHVYATEDREELGRILGQQYHAVVGNPPYVTVKDKALNDAYRERYGSCSGKYSVSVPFTERLFELGFRGHESQPAGYVGEITANSFMRREFGAKLVESFMPRWDISHVIDTSGAYIPGHGTPTAILFGRNQSPVAPTVRAVMGIRGEPTTPEDPAHGHVWTAITHQIDAPGSTGDWVSVADADRVAFHTHPWSMGGGGAAELKALLEEKAIRRLGQIAVSIGPGAILGEDDAFGSPPGAPRLRRLPAERRRPLVEGEYVRDWSVRSETEVMFPYDATISLVPELSVSSWFWPLRTVLWARPDFSKRTYRQCGRPYWEYHQIPVERNRTSLSIAFPFVATHNHFALDRGGKVFNRTAPVIKLQDGAPESEYLGILALLNSSTACFWMKQVCHNKGATSDSGVLQADPEGFRFEFDGTKLRSFPIPQLNVASSMNLLALARALQESSWSIGFHDIDALLTRASKTGESLRDLATADLAQRCEVRSKMVRWQEELDWLVYELFGLLPAPSPARSAIWSRSIDEMAALSADERAYRHFERGSRPSEAADLARVEAIGRDPVLALLERPEHKRRWYRPAGPYSDTPLTEEMVQQRALRIWLVGRLDSISYWPESALTTSARLADHAYTDRGFMQVAELYRNRTDFDVVTLVTELVMSEAVPFLPVLRYKEPGLRKRALWEETWDLQRREDRGEKVAEIPVPPKYTSADFLTGPFWRLRGKLDVPKERFISYPGCERDADTTPVVGWAGWDHLQQAQALATYYVSMKEKEGWPAERLVPLLAGLLELLPWLEQWHNEPDASVGMGMGEYFRRFLDEESRAQCVGSANLRSWRPTAKAKAKRRRRATMDSAAKSEEA